MENNEVMEIMNEEVIAENDAVLDMETETNEASETASESGYGDFAKKAGMALACGALGAMGAAAANEIIIPGAKKLIHKTWMWIKGKVSKKHAKNDAEAEPEQVEEPKETKKKSEKK